MKDSFERGCKMLKDKADQTDPSDQENRGKKTEVEDYFASAGDPRIPSAKRESVAWISRDCYIPKSSPSIGVYSATGSDPKPTLKRTASS